MGNRQKKRRTTGKKALAYRGKSDQNTDSDFLALGLRVVLYLPTEGGGGGFNFSFFGGPKCRPRNVS